MWLLSSAATKARSHKLKSLTALFVTNGHRDARQLIHLGE